MTVNKDDRNEKLIEELYEKLWWYTYDASEEEFDEKEVDAIVRLLDVLEPLKEETAYEPGAAAAFERFKKRYGLEEEFSEEESVEGESMEEESKEKESTEKESVEKESAEKETGTNVDMETDAGMEMDADVDTKVVGEIGTGTKADVASKAVSETIPDTSGKKKRHRKAGKRKTNWKKILIRLGVGAAACVVLMLTLNVGTYALREKSFFEIVEEALGRTEVIVTGVVEEEEGDRFHEEEYSDWDAVEEKLALTFLKPSYLPEGFQMVKLVLNEMAAKRMVIARYENENNYIRIEIDIYSDDFSRNMSLMDDEWELIEEDGTIKYYKKKDMIEAIFSYEQQLYHINSDLSIDELKKVISGLN